MCDFLIVVENLYLERTRFWINEEFFFLTYSTIVVGGWMRVSGVCWKQAASRLMFALNCREVSYVV